MKSNDEPLRNALLGYAAQLSTTHPPPASAVWLRAERRNRRLALERATRPLRIMEMLGLIVAIFASAWTLHQSSSAIDSTLILWGLLAILIVAVGCGTMLHVGRRLPS